MLFPNIIIRAFRRRTDWSVICQTKSQNDKFSKEKTCFTPYLSFTTQTRRTPRHTSELYTWRKQGPCVTELIRHHMENIPQVLKEQQLRMDLGLKSINCSERNWIWLLNSIQNRNLSGYSFPETVQLRFQWISWFLPSLRTAGEEMPGSAGTSAGSRTSNQGPTKLSKPLPQLTAPTKGPCPKCHRLSQVRCIRSQLTSVWPGTAVG